MHIPEEEILLHDHGDGVVHSHSHDHGDGHSHGHTHTQTRAVINRLSRAIGVRLCRWTEDATPGRLSLLEAEPLAAGVGIAALQKEGESVSGDKSTFFKTEQGVLCVLLSDGMGSGESAAKESMDTVHILEGLLRAGVDPATAMEMLNSLMLLKNGEE